MRSLFTSVFLLFTSLAIAQPPGYSYVLPVTVTNNSNILVTGYQLKLYINTQALITAGQMQSNGNDIRFGTPCNGDTLFHYFLDSGINSTATKIWVMIDTLQPLQSRTIYMFYGNDTASSASTISIFNGPFSSTDSITGGTSGGMLQCQRGFQFYPNEDILVTQFGKNEPSGTTRYITLFDNASQAIIVQDQVSGPASTYSYAALPNNLWLANGTSYVLEMYGLATDGYFYQVSSQINPHLTYQTMLYCNGCTQTTFPTTSLPGYQYGYPDMLFYTKNSVTPAPTYVTGAGGAVTLNSQPRDTTVCAGTNALFSLSAVAGTTLYYQWQVNDGTGFADITNAAPYSGALTDSLVVTNANISLTSYTYRCMMTSCDGLVISDTATLTVMPSVIPSVSISASPNTTVGPGTTITFTANITNGGNTPTFIWKKNGIAIPGATNSTYITNTLTNNNTIAVTIHSNATCAVPDSANSNVLTIHINVGVAQPFAADELTLYPNPNSGSFVLKGSMPGLTGNLTIEVVNAIGQVVYISSTSLNKGIISEQIDLGNLADGIYMLRAKIDSQQSILRFTIRK